MRLTHGIEATSRVGHVTIGLVCAAIAVTARAQEAGVPPAAASVVIVASVMDNELPGLAFILQNTADRDVPVPAFTLGDNGYHILTPSGRVEIRRSVVAEKPRRPLPGLEDGKEDLQPVLRPGESKTWVVPIKDLANRHQLSEEGIYRIYWECRGVKSRELTLVRRRPQPAGDEQLALPDPEGREVMIPNGPDPGQRNPKRVLCRFYRGLYEARPDWLLDSLYADNDASAAALQALQNQAAAALLLQTEIRKRFGDAVPAHWAPRWGVVAQVVRDVERAAVRYPEYFETATVDVGDNRVRLMRGDGNKWQIAAASFLGRDGNPHPAISETTAAVIAFRKRLGRGEFTTFEEANAALAHALSGSRTKDESDHAVH